MALRAVEEWARRIVSVELGADVEHNDDGSQPRMYDLRVGTSEAPHRAIEVVGAVDSVWTQTWNTGPARLSLDLDLAGDWMISVKPGANFKEVQKVLPALLKDLEGRGIQTLHVNASFRMSDYPLYDYRLYERFNSLGIDHVSNHRLNGSGKVTFHMMGPSGSVDSEGLAVPQWVSDFLSDPARADVLGKLAAVDAPHREVFIPVTLTGAPWGVVSYLTGISARELSLPSASPVLPHPLSAVWVVSTLSFQDALGVRWDGHVWPPFRCRGDGIDDESDALASDPEDDGDDSGGRG